MSAIFTACFEQELNTADVDNKAINNIVEQDNRFIKWRIQQGLGFKEFESARRTLSGIEIVRMIKKNQLIGQDKTMFKSFMSLAA